MRIANGLILLCLTVLLIGCGKQLEVRPVTVTKTVIEKVSPPAELLANCAEPSVDRLQTTGDLEALAVDALVALTFCNKDKERLREWQEEELQ